jgi:hypothetical protein
MHSIQKSDHPGYSFERAPWALITGVEPLNLTGRKELYRASPVKHSLTHSNTI